MAVCVVIQCVVVAVLLHVLQALISRRPFKPTIPRSSGLLITAMLIMFAGNMIQMAVWARVYLSLGEFDNFRTAFYHSTVNFTTLGYGDIVMSDQRRLLGALEAANGVLMFGLTTSLLYSVVSQLIRRMREEKAGSPNKSE
jgi:hypothetical protein